jgi:HEAT repeat protein
MTVAIPPQGGVVQLLPVLAILAVLLPPVAAAAGPGAAPLAPGALVAAGDQRRFSLRAREVSPESLLLNLHAQTGLAIVAPPDAPVTVEFADLPARAGAARIGAALGGLVPLRASWDDPRPGARHPRAETYYLVRPGSRRRQLLDAYALEQSGVAHERLFELLTAEGGALLPDALAQAHDAARGERERVLTIKLIGSLGIPEATDPLVAILRDGPGSTDRQAAAIALGWAGRPEAIPALRAALAGPDVDVALSAAWALLRLGDRSGVPVALSHARGRHALPALEAIAAAGDPAHIPLLEAGLAESRGLARLRTRTTIADLGMARLDEAGKILAAERLLADPDFEIRRHGAGVLARLGTPAAREKLERIAADPSRAGATEAAEAAARLRRSRQPPPEVTFE